MTTAVVRALMAQSAIIAVLLTVVADQVAHTHVERLGGVNIWGYRGPVLHQKKPNEIRVAVVGGDLSFGWGVAASEALAPSVRQLVALAIDRPGTTAVTVVTSVTIGVRGLAPDEYAAWIDRYAYLRPDVICVVPDPIGHVPTAGRFVPDRRSRAFATFGYSPILPLLLEEKAAAVHSPVRRMLGEALDWIDGLGTRPRRAQAVAFDSAYLDALQAAVRAGLRAASGVVVVFAPHEQDGFDRGRVRQVLASTEGAHRVRVVDLATDPRMHDDGLRLDGFSFSTAGHAVAAQNVTPAVLDLIRARDTTERRP